MGKLPKLALVLCLLLMLASAALVLWKHGAPGDEGAVDLTQSWALATAGPVMGPTQPLGSFASRPYLGYGWGLGQEDWRANHVAPQGATLRFYLSYPLNLKIRLEARSPAGPQEVPIRLNDNQWRSVKVEDDWRTFELEAEAQAVREGVNTLQVETKAEMQWRTFRVVPLEGSVTFAGEVPKVQVVGDSLALPWGQSVAYPLELTPQAWLDLDSCKAWAEPGAPEMSKGVNLVVRVRAHDPPFDRSWNLAVTGRLQRLPLPVERACSAELTLVAKAWQPSPPGQLGLLLTHPRVGGTPLEAHPLPSPSRGIPERPTHLPSVIIYLIDTLRADHLGCYGYSQPTSPHLDAFSKDGVLFRNCTAQSSWTKSATASILTSMLPRQHGALDYGDVLSPKAVLLAEILHNQRFHTKAIVTNGFVSEPFGFNRGFDQFTYKIMRADQVNSAVLPWLTEQTPERPFFLYLHTIDPHWPYHNPAEPGKLFSAEDADHLVDEAIMEDFTGKSNPHVKVERERALAAYDAAIRGNDAAFGQFIAGLKQRGLYDNTIIVVVADHGEEFLDHRRVGHQNSLYQELLQVLLLIKFPRSQAAGTVVSGLWQQIDVLPTILEVLGVPLPSTAQGRPYIPGGPPMGGGGGDHGVGDGSRPAYFSLKVGVDSEAFGQSPEPRLLDLDGVRVGSWVLTRTWAGWDPRNQPEELFDLGQDPRELVNQAFKIPDVAVRLQSLLTTQGLGGLTAPLSGKKDPQEIKALMRTLQYLR